MGGESPSGFLLPPTAAHLSPSAYYILLLVHAYLLLQLTLGATPKSPVSPPYFTPTDED